MDKILRRLESGKRWWAAEIVLRAVGLALLGLCLAASFWLYRSVHQPPPYEASARDYADALLAFFCWSAGCALLTVGPGLFQRIELPGRYARFTAEQGSKR